MTSYSFTLYIYADSMHSRAAVERIQWICEHALEGDCSITVIDVAAQPQTAELENILATPTLVKVQPPPEQRLIGDLSDTDLVIRLLGLNHP